MLADALGRGHRLPRNNKVRFVARLSGIAAKQTVVSWQGQ